MHVHGEGYCAFKPSVLILKSYTVFGVCVLCVFRERMGC